MITTDVATVDLVVTRYCEDLAWLDAQPRAWTRYVYDKSQGGPRQRITCGGWSSADGPDSSALWPDAIALPNVGCESHAHMHHIVERWESLAARTVFLSGDAPGHMPDIWPRVFAAIASGTEYHPFGDGYVCDKYGRPNVPEGLPELREAFAIFFPYMSMPDEFHWHGYSMYLASADRIRRFSRQQWMDARAWCTTKARSLAMERMYDLLLG